MLALRNLVLFLHSSAPTGVLLMVFDVKSIRKRAMLAIRRTQAIYRYIFCFAVLFFLMSGQNFGASHVMHLIWMFSDLTSEMFRWRFVMPDARCTRKLRSSALVKPRPDPRPRPRRKGRHSHQNPRRREHLNGSERNERYVRC